jgi:ligand-binding sensor protein
LSLRAADSWQLAHHGAENENGLCGMMAQQDRSCANCLRVQRKLRENAVCQPYTVVCGAGLSETAVPVRLGDKRVGFLHTGQVLLHDPAAAEFERTAKSANGWGVEMEAGEVREAYRARRVLPPKRYAAVIRLLVVFAEHLAMVGNQLLVQGQTPEPLVITRAKRSINDNYTEDLSLRQVAKKVHTSPFYFCKLFRRMTGVKFTEYLSSVRIEKARTCCSIVTCASVRPGMKWAFSHSRISTAFLRSSWAGHRPRIAICSRPLELKTAQKRKRFLI